MTDPDSDRAEPDRHTDGCTDRWDEPTRRSIDWELTGWECTDR